jgi:hypothetical protein
MKFISQFIDQIGEFNPQLFRELKGKFTPRNLGLTNGASVIGQVLIYLYFRGLLPHEYNQTHRLCVGSPPPGSEWYDLNYNPNPAYIPNNFCVKDLLGNYLINKELWWLDLFITMSVIGIFILLVVGTYVLIADFSKEESRGTLNFIRMSPQTAKMIFWGKLLGVPSLIYLCCLLAIPFHIFAGISAHIPLGLILGFYGVTIASCVCFYNAALLYGLITSGMIGFQAFLGSGVVLFFLLCMIGIFFGSSEIIVQNPIDWLSMFYPGMVLPYLVKATHINPQTIQYLSFESLTKLQWYGSNLWHNAWVGMGLSIANFGLWTYWITQALQRRFHNPLTTLLTKKQSYLISASFVIVSLGFVLQSDSDYRLQENFTIFQVFNLVFFLLLIAGLSPTRQTLLDWARYRHRVSKNARNLLADLFVGEKSPSTVAIALNLLLVTVYIIPSILLFPLAESKIPVLVSFVVSFSVILIYAIIAQLILFNRTSKQALWAYGTVGFLVFAPLIVFGIFQIDPHDNPLAWLFSMLPIVATEYAVSSTVLLAICSQWLAITVFGFKMYKSLQKAGASELKMLVNS